MAAKLEAAVELAQHIGWKEAFALVFGAGITIGIAACGQSMQWNSFAKLLQPDAQGHRPGYVAEGQCTKPVGTITKVCGGSTVSQDDAGAQASATTVAVCGKGNYPVKIGADGQPVLDAKGVPLAATTAITDPEIAQDDCVNPVEVGGGPGTASKTGTASATNGTASAQ
jgi:hypothetical protein